MSWFVLFCYIFFAYGVTLVVTQSTGPFNIFIRWRAFAESISDNFGLLFRCALCFPTNLGWVFSIINWFLIPVQITPFNMILGSTDLWWLAAIMDGAFTGAVCKIIWNIDDFIDKSTPIYEDEVDGDTIKIKEDDRILLTD